MAKIDFGFLERALHERRAYRCHGPYAAWRYEWMSEWSLDDMVLKGKTDGEDADFVFTGTHRMRPGNALGVARINEVFNVTLPADFDAFYRRWDGGVLLFREIYPLLSVEQMLEVNEWYVENTTWDRRSPWPLIRFCDMSNGDYLAMRLSGDGAWQVNFLSRESPDECFIVDWEQEYSGSFMDASFTAWVRRIIATDGWPVGFVSLYEDDIIPPTERIE